MTTKDTTSIKFSRSAHTNELWMMAAVAGGLWASFEIIIGSFLHNMRIPFAGSFLAATGVVLMISFHRLWPVKGLIWRAGLICALMKSISPSSLILGPMIGIMSEAFLLEISVRFIGSNITGYLLGGILGVSSALIHKVVSILILYGYSLIEVYLNIYRYTARQIGIINPDPWLLVMVLIGVYIIGGLIAALIGLSIPISKVENHSFQYPGTLQTSDNPLISTDRHFSLPIMIIYFLSIPFFILVISKSLLFVAFASVLIWSILTGMRYPGVFRRFRKPVLWWQFIIILVIATIFWEKDCSKFICMSLEGLMAGTEMTLRAMVVIVSFSAISIEIRNPVVRAFLEKKGLQNLYQSLTVAFSILPFMIANMPTARQLIREPRMSVSAALQGANELLIMLRKDPEANI
ncbi:MAG: hypothetical protein K0B15_02260 [Lentimicrobium sp.]|nr:hypothetical protein [Lentimicrobium sp.]